MKKSYLVVAMFLAGCQSKPAPTLSGYVETEPVRLAASVAGRLLTLGAEQGQALQQGQLAFQLDTESEQLGVAEAQARKQQAQAQAQDLDTGKRPSEIAVYQANVQAAQTAVALSSLDYQRQQKLAEQGVISAATLDNVKARRDADLAQLAQAQAQLSSAQLAGRSASRDAAQAAIVVATQQQAQKQWLVGQKNVVAPNNARVEQIYYRVGEWVPAGSPVLSLLKPDALKIRFYVPEQQLATFAQGKTIQVRCDGCQHVVQATVTYVAKEAEFTPPVIYNQDNRSRLVWLAEAKPIAVDRELLRAGQPVDVLLP